MPYIEAKLSIELNDSQKDELEAKLANVVSSAFSKPNAYIMTNIEDEKSLYMGGKKVEKGAYIEVKALGTVAKPSCQTATKEICDAFPEAKILMITAVGQQKNVITALENGAKDFMTKPFTQERLVETLKRLVEV